jgi:hypothetical protein
MVEAMEEVNRMRALVARDHVAYDVLGQVHRRAHVEVNDLELVGELGVCGEGAAGAAAGIEHQRVDGAAGRSHAAVELVHPAVVGEVDLNRLGLDPRGADALRNRAGVVVFSRHHNVVVVGGEQLCQLQADAAGGTGDHSERACRGFHQLRLPSPERPNDCELSPKRQLQPFRAG